MDQFELNKLYVEVIDKMVKDSNEDKSNFIAVFHRVFKRRGSNKIREKGKKRGKSLYRKTGFVYFVSFTILQGPITRDGLRLMYFFF